MKTTIGDSSIFGAKKKKKSVNKEKGKTESSHFQNNQSGNTRDEYNCSFSLNIGWTEYTPGSFQATLNKREQSTSVFVASYYN